jgi:glycogen synthase
MNVLMLGWELPPLISGGLGTACAGLLSAFEVIGSPSVTFALPDADQRANEFAIRTLHINPSSHRRGDTTSAPDETPEFAYPLPRRLVIPRQVATRTVARAERLSAYTSAVSDSVHLYTEAVRAHLATLRPFDVIHAHDWLTYEAGVAAKHLTGSKLIVHVHSTEYDRTGGRAVNAAICEAEVRGLQAADRIIAVSWYTKRVLMERYDISPAKISVVYNAVSDDNEPEDLPEVSSKASPIVSFIGRFTAQKSPETFMAAAYKIHRQLPEVRFVMAGEGEDLPLMRSLVRALAMHNILSFPGFLTREQVWRLLHQTDVLVVPSASEPFGIVALEAARVGVPVVLTRHCGLAEAMDHMLKVDPDDIDDIASHVHRLLTDACFKKRQSEAAQKEAARLTWLRAANEVLDVYRAVN